MSNYEERLALDTVRRQDILAFRLEAIARELKTIPLCPNLEQHMSIQATIEFIARLDAIKHG